MNWVESESMTPHILNMMQAYNMGSLHENVTYQNKLPFCVANFVKKWYIHEKETYVAGLIFPTNLAFCYITFLIENIITS